MSDETEYATKKRLAREDANWQNIADVDWTDLEFFIEKARRTKDKEAFDIAISVLQGLKEQVTKK